MKKSFITGLVILLPLALTVAIVVFIVNLLTAPFVGVVQEALENWNFLDKNFLFFTRKQIITYISQILILVILFIFTTGLGVLTRWFFVHSLLNFGDYLLQRIPLVNKVYTTTQEIMKTLVTSRKKSFKQVVIVPFPNKDTHSIGFVTNDAPEVFCKETNSDLVSVFMPTTPNPTSGYLLMFKRSDIVFLKMSVEDAVRFIISCGVIHPHKKKLNKTNISDLLVDEPE